MTNPYAPPAAPLDPPQRPTPSAVVFRMAWGAFRAAAPVLLALSLVKGGVQWVLGSPLRDGITDQALLVRAVMVNFAEDFVLNGTFLPVVGLLAVWRMSAGEGLGPLFRRGYLRLLALVLVFELITTIGDQMLCVPGALARLAAFTALDPLSVAIDRRGLFVPSRQATARLTLMAPVALVLSVVIFGAGMIDIIATNPVIGTAASTLSALVEAFCWFFWIAACVANRP